MPSKLIIGIALSMFLHELHASPVDTLRQQEPVLFKLYQENSRYVPALELYARNQGFREPVEQLATTVHEIIHISSATHQGYFIAGIYYEPYLNTAAWPALTNKDIAPFVRPEEKGAIYHFYMPNTPENGMGNVLDEINAHSQVAAFVCRNEPASGSKQVRNLIGHLDLQEAYLRVTREQHSTDFRRLVASKASAGAITTITKNAWEALLACGVNINQLRKQEVVNFMAQTPQ